MLAQDESLVVIGVNPSDAVGLYIFPGEIVNGQFEVSIMSNAVISGKGQDGYLVTKAKAGKTLGIVNFFVYGEGPLTGRPYKACAGHKVLTFKVPPGQLIYLGDFDYTTASGKLTAQVHEDLPKAASFVRKNYSEINGQLVQAQNQWVPINRPCNSEPILIFLPVRR